jgi:hypothetical protein
MLSTDGTEKYTIQAEGMGGPSAGRWKRPPSLSSPQLKRLNTPPLKAMGSEKDHPNRSA